MEDPLPFVIFILISLFGPPCSVATDHPSCLTSCGSLQLKYPFGSGSGCGSMRFHPYVTCAQPSNQLLLTTHSGSYPITSISYSTSTLTITPPYMSTCTSMQQSPDLGLDWASPFQLGPSTFLLLSCIPPTSSLITIEGVPVCDPSSSYLCTSFYTCPSVIGLGLPLFPPTNTCCVYSPANLNDKDELDLKELQCGGFTSVVSLMDYPTDPSRWECGVSLKYTHGAFDNYYIDNRCKACEDSGGVCGYSPPDDYSFVCVCKNGVNTTTQCSNFMSDQDEGIFWSSASSLTWKSWLEILAGLLLFFIASTQDFREGVSVGP